MCKILWVVLKTTVYGCRLGDEAEALRCYQDAHRMFPANMDVISWLGAFHVKNEVQTAQHTITTTHDSHDS